VSERRVGDLGGRRGDIESSEVEHKGSAKRTGQVLQDEEMTGVRRKMAMNNLCFERALDG
jgi:hypothetical protein